MIKIRGDWKEQRETEIVAAVREGVSPQVVAGRYRLPQRGCRGSVSPRLA